MKKILFTLLISIFFIPFVSADEEYDVLNNIDSSNELESDATTIVGDLPEGRYYPAVGMIGDDIYIYGGATTGYVQTNNLYKFNIKDNTITTLRNGQTSIAPRMAIIGTDIYIVVTETSSGSGSNLITKYNTLTNGYVEYMAEMPQPLRNPAVAVVETDIYIIGGRTGTNNLVNTMYKYDTLTNSYTTITMPFYFQGRMGIAVGTDVYIFGSYTSSATSSSVVTSYKYDTLTGEFTQIADFPLSSTPYTPPVANGTDIYIVNSAGNMSYVYNTLTNTYTEKSDISSTVNGWGFGAAFKDNYLYYVGGNANSTVLTTISKKPLVQGGDIEEPEPIIPDTTLDSFYSLYIEKLSSLGQYAIENKFLLGALSIILLFVVLELILNLFRKGGYH